MSGGAPPLPGDRVGPYVLGESLGVGGMAVVYRAVGADGPVALKILHQGRITPDEVKRFRREYLTLDRLDHPNVVKVVDAGEHAGYPWLALELVEGHDLGAIIEKWQADPPPDRWDRVEHILIELCNALAYVHENGIIHRDLKPGNVLIGRDGAVRLTDFGVVKDPDVFTTNLTMAGRLVGTVAFMAPEQITGDAVDARADLYSLGALLYTMLTLRRPIVADSIAGYLARHLTEMPRAPSEIDPRIPPRLERVCMKLLQKDPARRFASARFVVRALAEEPPTGLLGIHGRERELERIATRVDELVRRGRGGVVAVVGPAGSGRTRLLSEVVERAQNAGASAALAGPIATIPALLAEMPDALASGGPVAQLRARMGEARWLLAIDDADQLSPEDGAVVGELVRAVIAGEGGPLLVVVAVADVAASPIANGQATGLPAEEVVLAGLDRDALRGMLRDRGLHGGLGAALGRRLHDELGGWPGATVEQLDALVRAGWLVRSPDNSLRATRPVEALRADPLPLPDRVRTVEAAFLGALPPGERSCVEALAVLASPASVALVAPVAGISEVEASAALGTMARDGQLSMDEDGLQEIYAIPQRRRAQVVYESIETGRRAAMHRAAAEALQRVYRRRSGAIAEVAAHHLLHGGDPANAYPLLIAAAQRAVRRPDFGAAKLLCQRALESRAAAEAWLSPMDGARWRRQLYQALGDTLRAGDHPDQAEDAYAQALIAARQEGDRAAIGRALAGVGIMAAARGRARESASSLEEALAALEQGDPAWPDAAHVLAVVRLDAGDRLGAAALWSKVGELGTDTRNVLATINAAWGQAMVRWGEGIDPSEPLSRAVSAAREAGADEPLARSLRSSAERALERGDNDTAARIADELESLAESASLPLADVIAHALRARVLANLGEDVASRTSAREALSLCRLHRVALIGIWAHPVRVLAMSGDAEEAVASLGPGPWLPDLPWDVEAVRHSLLAMARVAKEPQEAAREAHMALARPAAGCKMAAKQVELDCGWVLEKVGDEAGAERARARASLR